MAQPSLVCSVDGHKFKGLVDTGADISIIKSSKRPSDWPTINLTLTLTGVEQLQHPRQSAHLQLVLGPVGQTVRIVPYCCHIMYLVGKRCFGAIWNHHTVRISFT